GSPDPEFLRCRLPVASKTDRPSTGNSETANSETTTDPAPDPTEGHPAEIDLAFRMALARRPGANEAGAGRGRPPPPAERMPRGEAGPQALAQLCLTLFNTNEFLYAE